VTRPLPSVAAEDLRMRIFERLMRSAVDRSVGELAALLKVEIRHVSSQLHTLVGMQRVKRIHSPDGVLRYRALIHPANTASQTPCSSMDKLLDDIDAVAAIGDAMDRLASLELLGARVAMHLQSAMTEAEAARARNSPEDK
jgi:hypothetical protein